MNAPNSSDPTLPVLLRYRALLIVLGNLTIATTAYVAAFALRFDLSIPPPYVTILLVTLPLLLVCKFIGFWTLGLFSGWWSHLSVRDAEDVVRGNLLASGLFLSAVVLLQPPGLDGYPRAVFLLDLVLCTALMGGARLAIRLAREQRERGAVRRVETLALIVGAGEAGIRLLNEIESRRRLKIGVVGFVDDDPAKLGLRVCGVPVLGRVDDLPTLVAAHEIGEVLIAVPSASGTALRRIVQRCGEAGVRHRVLPTLGELVEGRVMYTQMREVQMDDLLPRKPARLDRGRLQSLIAGKTVLVTGAAGSIGSELCRHLSAYEPERLVLYDRHENGLFVLEMEFRARFPDVRVEPVLGDVLLEDQLRSVFAAHRPDLVFHAAAYKHVPMAERNVLEAARNNIIGTSNVAQAALAHGSKEFVLVSTDKAVRPTSVMGVTKRVAEMVVQGLQNGGCGFVSVRFGNVLGSSGSVVPLFREQICRGGPVTVTNPDVTRYFMTVPEAAELILLAAALGNGGDVFILDMGEPVRIVDLARQMIRLSGFEPDEDVEIVFTGLRPGEKLHEQLVSAEEEITATYHERIKVVRSSVPPLVDTWLPSLQACLERGDLSGTVGLLQALVPHYQPSAFLLQALCETEARRNHEREAADDLRNYRGRVALPTRRPHRIVPA
jgi:FlaA1/EpsC-like NDP-sugar epimerase